jgi:hypothetical protein
MVGDPCARHLKRVLLAFFIWYHYTSKQTFLQQLDHSSSPGRTPVIRWTANSEKMDEVFLYPDGHPFYWLQFPTDETSS